MMPNLSRSVINCREAESASCRASGEISGLDLSKKIERMRGHAYEERCAGLNQAVDQARTAEQVVNDDLAAHRERHDHGAETQIVAQRAQRIDDRLFVDIPIGR